jgi:hypothetical protein
MTPTSAGRRDKLIEEKRHDVYRETAKWPEPTACTQCGSLFSGGRWSWEDAPAVCHRTVCPACRRIAERFPAGEVELRGEFVRLHRDDIMHLIQNTAKREKSQRPLERIMNIAEENRRPLVPTTGIHLARRIGEALHRAHKGELSVAYAKAENRIRIGWRRDD